MATFKNEDLGIIEEAMHLAPELRVCVLAVRQARQLKIKYPLNSRRDLVRLLGKESFVVEDLRASPELVEQYIIDDDFPIADERELIRAVYVALSRCNEDLHWAARASQNAQLALREYGRVPTGAE